MERSKITYLQRYAEDVIQLLPAKKTDSVWTIDLKHPLQFQTCPMNYNGDNVVSTSNKEMIEFIKSLQMQFIRYITTNSVEIFGKDKQFSSQELFERMEKLWELTDEGVLRKEINPNAKVRCVDNNTCELSEIKTKVYVLYKINSLVFTKSSFKINFIQLGVKEHLSRVKSSFVNYFQSPPLAATPTAVPTETAEPQDASIKIILPKQFF